MARQIKKGYLRGCRGLLLTELNADGSSKTGGIVRWVDTAQEASIEVEIVEGETSELRGGDRLLVQVQENDVVIGANVDFTDARTDLVLLKLIAGGTFITEGSGDTEEIIGWEAPKIEDQSEKIPFKAELYVQSFNSQGGREAYLKYDFPYCIATIGSISHSDQDWGTPEFSLKARENPSTKETAYKKSFVSALPAIEYTVAIASVVGGTAVVTTDPDDKAAEGATVTVSIATIEANKQFKSIKVADVDGVVVSTTTVTAGENYSFVMPGNDVTVTVTLEELG